MGSSQQAFLSTPTFELFRRGLQVATIKQFHGLNAYNLVTNLGPDWAQDLLNVIISGSGGISKMRLPVKLTPNLNFNFGPGSFWDFQQANGTRQVLAQFGQSLYYFSNDLANATLIEMNVFDTGQWSFSPANNILFGANGQRMMKWIGGPSGATNGWQNWGIQQPGSPPTLTGFSSAFSQPFNSGLVRAANVVTGTLNAGSSAIFLAVNDVITVSGAADPSFNGTFAIASVVTPGSKYTWNQTGANATSGSGTMTAGSQTGTANISSATRSGGVATVVFTGPAGGFETGGLFGLAFTNSALTLFVTIAGATDASFNGTWQVSAYNRSTQTLTIPQPLLPDSAGGAAGTVSTVLTSSSTGWLWGYSYRNSITGHAGNMSPASAVRVTGTNRTFGLSIPAPNPADGQIDSVILFRTLDGGGDFFQDQIVAAPSFPLSIPDTVPDANLDQTKRAPLINNVPIVGLYTAVGQSRVFVFNILGSPQDIIYSGYEQISIGRPEESFPPNNRLRLSIGAEAIAGGGVLQAGVVAFSQTQRMYMLRGQVEDISLAVPINFTQYLEELPWTLGCKSHFTVQTTPYGLVWLAGDKTIQLFDGRSEPIDISPGVYPLLRRITPGQEGNCVSGYFNWLERDWYALLAPVDGSLTINRIFFFAFNKSIGTNTVDSVECFVSDIPNQINGTTWIGLITTSKLQRLLCIGAGGFIQNLPITSDTVGGITQDYTINPATAGNLSAFWRGGYLGNADPQRSKNFRWARLITDQAANSFQMQFRMVDDEQRTLVAPEIIGPRLVPTGRVSINRRAKRMAPEINFPAADAPSNVLELQLAAIATSER